MKLGYCVLAHYRNLNHLLASMLSPLKANNEVISRDNVLSKAKSDVMHYTNKGNCQSQVLLKKHLIKQAPKLSCTDAHWVLVN